jgi:NO-binding membrane sensor protein with MHYT domain
MDFNPTLSLHLLLLVLVAVLTCLSIQLGLSWADRAWADEGAERLLGRLASGASIATGLWCAQTWANMATHGGSALAYLEWDRLAFWLLATLAGAAALTGASARQTAAWRWLGASVSLGTALAALHVLSSQATHD